MIESWHITDGRVIDPARGIDEVTDLYIEDGNISTIPENIPHDARHIDATGLVIAPGFIDIHVHFREPGNEDAETISTGSLAAAHGGFTSVVLMPNTTPAADSPEIINNVVNINKSESLVRLIPSACITKERKGKELADLPALAKSGAMAFSDDGSTVPDEKTMEKAMAIAKDLNIPVMDHALDNQTAGDGVMREGDKANSLNLPGIPAAAEILIVERDISLAKKTGCSIHIQHISCKESVHLIRAAQEQGIPVSGEATPHHLALTDNDVTHDTNFKMSPPLGNAEDMEELRAGIVDGTLQAFATDHAPHTEESKNLDFTKAPFGVIGLETAIGVTFTTMVQSGLMDISEWISRWTSGPAEILRIKPPDLTPGQPADIVILDIDNPWKINSALFHSKATNTPFEDHYVTGRAMYTFCKGSLCASQYL